jgi:hypothetical protein
MKAGANVDVTASANAFRHATRVCRWQEPCKDTLVTLFASCTDFDLPTPF